MKKYLTLEQFSLKEDSTNNPGLVRKKYLEFFTKMNIQKSEDMKEIQEQIDEFCIKLNITKVKFQYECLFILSDFFQAGKYNAAIKEREIEINPEELDTGIKFEMEHTRDPLISKRIALDHLCDCGEYYTLLRELEEKCKNGNNREKIDKEEE